MRQRIERNILLEPRCASAPRGGSPGFVRGVGSISVSASSPAPAPDWQTDINHDSLIRNPEVRDLLAKQKPAAYHMTGEEFVEAFGSLLPVKFPLAPLMNFSKELGGRHADPHLPPRIRRRHRLCRSRHLRSNVRLRKSNRCLTQLFNGIAAGV